MFLLRVLNKMKRKAHSPPNTSSVKYHALNHEVSESDCPTEDCRPARKNGILCASSKKRFYFFLIMTAVVLLWIGIYYKLLNHRFALPEPFRELRRIFGDGPSKMRRKFRESETENIAVGFDEHNPMPINIAITACKNRIDEAFTVLKSATLFTKHHLNFYIFTDQRNWKKETFESKLRTWPAAQQHWMMHYIYPAEYPDIIHDRDKEEWENLFKKCASLRVFFASKLMDVDSVIYVDTDVLFLKPPEELWKYFKNFSPTQIAGLAQECDIRQKNCLYLKQAKHPSVAPAGVNTGVMLMNLTRMRELEWEEELIHIYDNNKHLLRYGDQDILNIYFHAHPKLLYVLPCEWNYRPDFCYNGFFCERAIKKGISILHGSRLSFQKSKVQPEFHAVYKVFKDFTFGSDIAEEIVLKIRTIFSKKYHETSCGHMVNSILLSVANHS